MTRSGAALPAGVTLVDNGDGTGTLSGTAGAGTAGTLRADVHRRPTASVRAAIQTFTLTVNQAPTITSANTATFTVEHGGATFTVVMTGTPAPTVSVTSGVLPDGRHVSSATARGR